GIAFRAVRVHFDGSRTRPGNGTPNSRSVRFGCGFGWGMVFRVVGLGFRQNPRPTLQYTVAVRLCEIRLKGDRVPVLDSLAGREQPPERMDAPGLAPAEHRAAPAPLAGITRLSFPADTLGPPRGKLARRFPNEMIRVLDIATGGGDLPVRLW